jgi:hypothetical protein
MTVRRAAIDIGSALAGLALGFAVFEDWAMALLFMIIFAGWSGSARR